MRLVREGPGGRWEIELRPPEAIVGRDPDCGVRIASSKVSRRHARLSPTAEGIEVLDLGSRNGTFLNGARVERALMKPGDRLRIGDVQFQMPPEGAPPAPAPAAPPAAAPEPEGFEPSEDAGSDTPVDEFFAPVPSASHAPAVATEVVARDGRWFLRDPRSAREVEIVPVQRDGRTGEAVAIPTAGPARVPPWLNRRILAGALAVLVLALAVWLCRPKPAPLPLPKPFPPATYDQEVDALVECIRTEKDLQGWREKLLALDRKIPERKTAKYWADIVPFFQGIDRTTWKDFQWDEIGRFLGEVESADHATPPQRTFARDFKDFIARREQDGGAVAAAERLAGRLEAEEKEKGLDAYEAAAGQVIDKFRAVAARRGLYQARARKGLEEVQHKLRTLLLQDAETKTRAAEAAIETDPDVRRAPAEIAALLDAAVKAAERGRSLFDTATLEEMGRRRNAVAKEQKSRIAYADGRAHHEAGREAAAIAAFRGIDPASPLAAKAKAIQDSIEQKRTTAIARARATALFMDGKGGEALEALRNAGLSDPALEGKVRRIQEATAEAEQAEKAADFPKARAAWSRVTVAAADPGNAYHREAKLRIAAISPGVIANRHYEKGKASFDAGKWREAREWFAKAREADPSTTLGAAEIEKLQKDARALLNKAFSLKSEKPDESRKIYLQILEMVEETDPLADTARKRLAELDAAGGGAAP